MKYTEDIFNLLSKGGFISANSISVMNKRLYDAIEDNFEEYYNYYSGIGLYLEAGNGYFFFTRKESKVDLERKLESALKWIDYLSFLKTFNSIFSPGFTFRAADIVIQLGCDIELKEKASKLFSDKKKHNEVVDKLIKELKDMGFIELENELEETWKVLTSFHYIEELIDCITISEEYNNEIPQ
ncbi:MAG: condensin complex protein MksE [Bacteroidales bacterium]